MTSRRVTVTQTAGDPHLLPECFSEFALLWRHLDESGLLDKVEKRLPLSRGDGCCGRELFALLFAMWSSGACGQRALYKRMRGRQGALASLMGAHSVRSQSAMSRALQSVTDEMAGELCDWLLGPEVGGLELEKASSAFYYDTHGDRWKVFDVDGRVVPLRTRKLPTEDGLPPPQRRSDLLAKPGYSGRKRGDIQLHEMLVEDAGTGRVVGFRPGPGNGDHRGDLLWAAQRAACYTKALQLPEDRTILRFDGKSSGLPVLANCRESGVHFLTRWADYSLFQSEQVRERMQQASWYEVEDSGSGPRRLAVDLGLITIHPGESTKRSDGTAFPPMRVRLVVTRYPVEHGEKHGAGIVLDGHHYELFVTSVPAEFWPAPEITELYYGRAGQENRFIQHDRELGRRRVISNHLPGQSIATGVGLFLLNLRASVGAFVAGWTPEDQVDPEPRGPRMAPPPPPLPQNGSASLTESDTAGASLQPEHVVLFDEQEAAESVRDAVVRLSSDPPAKRRARAQFLLWLLPWRMLLAQLDGWKWNDKTSQLACPAGRNARLHRVRPQRGGAAIHFRMGRACITCPLRERCLPSAKEETCKEVSFSLRADMKLAPAGDQRTPSAALGGPYRTRSPRLVPSALRSKLRTLSGAIRIAVASPTPPPAVVRAPDWIAPDRATRQHRRLSFEQRRAKCLLPSGTQLTMNVAIDADLAPTERRAVIQLLSARSHEEKQ